MKRSLSILALTVILLFATSCRTQTDMSMISENDSAQSDNSNLESKDVLVQKVDEHIQMYQLSIFDYDEYVMFVKKTMLPDYFVSYEELSEFGTFNGFVCLSDATAQDYSSLIYAFVDESGEEFSMYVNYTPKCSFAESKKTKAAIDSKNINTSDMRTVKVTESQSCKYSYQGIEYVYSMHGEIMSITWYCGDIEFVLSGIGGYPKTDKTTMVNSLFNLDTALQVVNNIKLD